MDMTFEDQIRERAYQIWQAGGMADGQAQEHWVSAEQAVRSETAGEPEVILTKARVAKTTKAAKTIEAKPASTNTAKAKAAKPAESVAVVKTPVASKAKSATKSVSKPAAKSAPASAMH